MIRKCLLFFVGAFVLVSCSDDKDTAPRLTAYEESVIQYFSEIALGFEFGGASETTRKWTTDMKIFVGGNKTTDLMNELQNIITEVNSLATDGFDMSVVSDSLQSNFYIFLGSGSDYISMFPSLAGLVENNWGLFSIYFNSGDQLYSGYMYVDLIRATPRQQKHLLREELTQSLGLAKDSPLYDESIFQSRFTETNNYAPIDRDLIRLLYHPKMKVGLTDLQVSELLKEIILTEK